MTINHLKDLDRIHEIYTKHYSNEFHCPSFNEFYNPFQVSMGGKLVTAGGIRLIPEMILITDKDVPVLERRIALNVALDVVIKQTKDAGYIGMHAFVKPGKWKERMIKEGFRPAEGDCLIYEV